MTPELKAKINAILALDTPANYECWEYAEEGLLEELTEEEQEEYTNGGESMVEEWFAYNEDETHED